MNITTYTRRDRSRLMHLLYDEDRLHLHLDWTTVDEWIEQPEMPLFLAWEGHTLLGAIAAAPPLNGATWLRLVAFAEEGEIEPVLAALWDALKHDLLERQVYEIAALMLRGWIKSYLAPLGFAPFETIVTLRRDGPTYPDPINKLVKLRRGSLNDVNTATEIDHAAFSPVWRMERASIWQAARHAALFTIAELDGQPVAYQISSQYREGGHLARLATLPDHQGQGLGGALIADLIAYFLQRNIRSVTVNTQQSNTQSLNLYHRYGFRFTGLNMDVWRLALTN